MADGEQLVQPGGRQVVRLTRTTRTAVVASLVLAAGTAALTGCSSSDVTLDSRPTDAGSAQDLAELVADKADCGSFEYYDDTQEHWDFTCQAGNGSYLIRVVGDDNARKASLDELGVAPPVKAGAYFLVQAATGEDGTATGGLDRFPGDVAGAGSG